MTLLKDFFRKVEQNEADHAELHRSLGVLQSTIQQMNARAQANEESLQRRATHTENLLADALALTRYTEERSRTLEAQVSEALVILHDQQARSAAVENQWRDLSVLVRTTEERTQTLEKQLNDALMLMHTTEQRSRTLQFQGSETLAQNNFQIDLLRKWYVESMPAVLNLNQLPAALEAGAITIKTDHPVALASNDHLEPDSTAEGLVRPTQFVRHCIDLLGADIRCLELGAGAAGLLFEYIQNGLVAVGIDGSDYCMKNRIGYWPLIPHNLFTCDLTHPFQFHRIDNSDTVKFDLITAWEVFEHIAEKDLSQTMRNVAVHLEADGYFIGSISRIEYCDKNGKPYHVTLQPLAWWKQKFKENGLWMVDDNPFNLRLFCRGNGPRFQDFHNYFDSPDDGFHFVAKHATANLNSGS